MSVLSGILKPILQIYLALEDKYYDFLDFLASRGLDLYKVYATPVERLGIPSFLLLLLLLLFGAAAGGYFFIAGSSAGTSNYSVLVMGNDQPVVEAQVELYKADALVKSVLALNGRAVFKSLQGQFSVSVSSEGCESASADWDVSKQKSLKVYLSCAPTPTPVSQSAGSPEPTPLPIAEPTPEPSTAGDKSSLLLSVTNSAGKPVASKAMVFEARTDIKQGGTYVVSGSTAIGNLVVGSSYYLNIESAGYARYFSKANPIKIAQSGNKLAVRLFSSSINYTGIAGNASKGLLVLVVDTLNRPTEGAAVTIYQKGSKAQLFAERQTNSSGYAYFDSPGNGTFFAAGFKAGYYYGYSSLFDGGVGTTVILLRQKPIGEKTLLNVTVFDPTSKSNAPGAKVGIFASTDYGELFAVTQGTTGQAGSVIFDDLPLPRGTLVLGAATLQGAYGDAYGTLSSDKNWMAISLTNTTVITSQNSGNDNTSQNSGNDNTTPAYNAGSSSIPNWDNPLPDEVSNTAAFSFSAKQKQASGSFASYPDLFSDTSTCLPIEINSTETQIGASKCAGGYLRVEVSVLFNETAKNVGIVLYLANRSLSTTDLVYATFYLVNGGQTKEININQSLLSSGFSFNLTNIVAGDKLQFSLLLLPKSTGALDLPGASSVIVGLVANTAKQNYLVRKLQISLPPICATCGVPQEFLDMFPCGKSSTYKLAITGNTVSAECSKLVMVVDSIFPADAIPIEMDANARLSCGTLLSYVHTSLPKESFYFDEKNGMLVFDARSIIKGNYYGPASLGNATIRFGCPMIANNLTVFVEFRYRDPRVAAVDGSYIFYGKSYSGGQIGRELMYSLYNGQFPQSLVVQAQGTGQGVPEVRNQDPGERLKYWIINSNSKPVNVFPGSCSMYKYAKCGNATRCDDANKCVLLKGYCDTSLGINCASGQCVNNHCVRQSGQQPQKACASVSDCPTGYSCMGSLCSIASQYKGCTVDSDCGSGKCTGSGFCAVTPYSQCTNSNNMPGSQSQQSCPAGQACIGGVCSGSLICSGKDDSCENVNGACQSCQAGYRCGDANQCVPVLQSNPSGRDDNCGGLDPQLQNNYFGAMMGGFLANQASVYGSEAWTASCDPAVPTNGVTIAETNHRPGSIFGHLTAVAHLDLHTLEGYEDYKQLVQLNGMDSAASSTCSALDYVSNVTVQIPYAFIVESQAIADTTAYRRGPQGSVLYCAQRRGDEFKSCYTHLLSWVNASIIQQQGTIKCTPCAQLPEKDLTKANYPAYDDSGFSAGEDEYSVSPKEKFDNYFKITNSLVISINLTKRFGEGFDGKPTLFYQNDSAQCPAGGAVWCTDSLVFTAPANGVVTITKQFTYLNDGFWVFRVNTTAGNYAPTAVAVTNNAQPCYPESTGKQPACSDSLVADKCYLYCSKEGNKLGVTSAGPPINSPDFWLNSTPIQKLMMPAISGIDKMKGMPMKYFLPNQDFALTSPLMYWAKNFPNLPSQIARTDSCTNGLGFYKLTATGKPDGAWTYGMNLMSVTPYDYLINSEASDSNVLREAYANKDYTSIAARFGDAATWAKGWGCGIGFESSGDPFAASGVFPLCNFVMVTVAKHFHECNQYTPEICNCVTVCGLENCGGCGCPNWGNSGSGWSSCSSESIVIQN